MEEILDEILEDLAVLETDIPDDIKSNIPRNVKSANVRSIHERTNDIITRLAQVAKSLSEGDRGIHEGEDDPNENPPSDPKMNDVYLQRNDKGVILEYFIYTMKPAPSWVPIKFWETSKKYYADIPNPNLQVIPNPDPEAQLNPYKIGDFYVQTSTGTSSGNVQSVWMYLGYHTGEEWINLAGSGSSILYTAQTLSATQKRQVLKNLGWIEIGGNLFEYKKRPDNPGLSVQAGDIAVNGWISSTRFGKLLVFSSGEHDQIGSWNVLDEIEF